MLCYIIRKRITLVRRVGCVISIKCCVYRIMECYQSAAAGLLWHNVDNDVDGVVLFITFPHTHSSYYLVLCIWYIILNMHDSIRFRQIQTSTEEDL